MWIGVALLLATTVCLAVVAAEGELPILHVVIAYGIAAVVVVALPQLGWWAIMRRHRDAFEREDADDLRALARALEGSLPAHAASLTLGAMMVDERHAEVRERCLAALPRARAKAQRATLNNALAWATALAGDAEAAIPIAEAAIAEGDVLPIEAFALCHGTLGVALVLAQRHEEGLAQLEKATSMGGTPRAQAIRAYYLGEALRALGRVEDARAAYTRCIDARPTSRWASRARAEMDKLGGAYR